MNKLTRLRFTVQQIRSFVTKPKVQKIEKGDQNYLAEHRDRIYVWGLSETGALGLHTSQKKHKSRESAFVQHPTKLKFSNKYRVLDVACGYGFTALAVAKRPDDPVTLFGCGINTDSQLGHHSVSRANENTYELVIYPIPIPLPDVEAQVVKCAAGRAHLLTMTDQGVVYILGNNAYGQCGRQIVQDEKYQGNSVIHQVKLDNVKDIICGQDHSFFITHDGRVFSCGWGSDGQTGLGHYNTTSEPSLVGGDVKGEKIVKVSSMADCVLALNDKGQVFGWGNAEYGQIPDDNNNQQINTPKHLKMCDGFGKIVDVATGGSNCMILNENGDVFVWGYGILGLGPSVDHIPKPTLIPPTIFGRNPLTPNARIISIESGISHMAAISDENDLFMWGRNKFGCLGLGHTKDQFFPLKACVGAKVLKVRCGVDHTVAIGKSFS